MNRAELVRLLSILIRQGQITEVDAREVLRLFDAGQLRPEQLPIPFAERNRAVDYAAILAAIALLLGGAFGRRLLTGAPIPLYARQSARDRLRDGFDRSVTRLANGLTTNVQRWHVGMATEVSNYIARQFVAGAGRLPAIAERTAIAALIATQMAFLYRFAGHVAARIATGRPLSSGYIANRATQYGGTGWRAWHEGAERRDGQGDGIVAVYDALDDNRTCGPCSAAERNGPYLPGSGHPWPGDVCQGKGRCRCTIRFEYDPAAWERLTGRRLAA